MDFIIKLIVGILFSAWAALVAWLIFPDKIIDLGYWEWFLVSVTVETIVGSALASRDLAKA